MRYDYTSIRRAKIKETDHIVLAHIWDNKNFRNFWWKYKMEDLL